MVLSHCVKKFEIISMLTLTTFQDKYGTKYSRVDQVKIFKGCLPQILLGPLLNTWTHIGSFRQTLLFITLYFLSVFEICLTKPTRNYQKQIMASKDCIEAFKNIFQLVIQTSAKRQCHEKGGSLWNTFQILSLPWKIDFTFGTAKLELLRKL